MSSSVDPLTEYLQVRRVLARVCLASENLSPEERTILASNVGGASSLPQDKIDVLVKDASEMPDIGMLTKSLTQPCQIKQLLIDLAALSVVKGDRQETELAALGEVVNALPVDEGLRSGLNQAFQTLRTASEARATAAA